MRTTIRIDDDLLAEVKKFTANTRKTLTAVIEDALREVLARGRQPRRGSKPKLTTFGGKGVQAGVDLDDSASLLDRMERPDGAY